MAEGGLMQLDDENAYLHIAQQMQLALEEEPVRGLEENSYTRKPGDITVVSRLNFPPLGRRYVYPFGMAYREEKTFTVSSTLCSTPTFNFCAQIDVSHENLVASRLLVFAGPGERWTLRAGQVEAVFVIVDVLKLRERIILLPGQQFAIAAKPGCQFVVESRGNNWIPGTEMAWMGRVDVSIYNRIATISCPANTMRFVRISALNTITTNAQINVPLINFQQT